MKRLTLLLAGLVALGCGDDDTDDPGTESFLGGNFQFTNLAVTDGCTDNAMVYLFMPEGTASDWAKVTELPSEDKLPLTYTVQAPDPYGAVEVNAKASGTTGFEFSETTQKDVLLDNEKWPGCKVDVTISGNFVIVDPNKVTGSLTLTTTSYDEPNCIAVDEEPCSIVLDVEGNRVQ